MDGESKGRWIRPQLRSMSDGETMRLSDKEEVELWLSSVEDRDVRNHVRELIDQGKLPAIIIPDAVIDQVRIKLHPAEYRALKSFGNTPFSSD